MILKSEVIIDIDAKRKIWITNEAAMPDDKPAEDIGKVANELSDITLGSAMAALGRAAESLGVQGEPDAAAVVAAARASAGGEGGIPMSEREPRPEHPETMRTFGDDDEEEADHDAG